MVFQVVRDKTMTVITLFSRRVGDAKDELQHLDEMEKSCTTFQDSKGRDHQDQKSCTGDKIMKKRALADFQTDP